eukprot:761812-Hanusia_phi.AAC.4
MKALTYLQHFSSSLSQSIILSYHPLLPLLLLLLLLFVLLLLLLLDLDLTNICSRSRSSSLATSDPWPAGPAASDCQDRDGPSDCPATVTDWPGGPGPGSAGPRRADSPPG